MADTSDFILVGMGIASVEGKSKQHGKESTDFKPVEQERREWHRDKGEVDPAFTLVPGEVV